MVQYQQPSTEQLTPDFLLDFYKVMSDPQRLRIVGLLSSAAQTVLALAAAVDASPADVAHHLARLVAIGVAVERSPSRFALDEAGLRRRARASLDSPRTRELAGATDERSRVLATFLRNGRLTQFPTGGQRKVIILEEICRSFDVDRTYTEREVNEVLKGFFDDYTTLRRAMIDYHFMNRHQSVYWLGAGRTELPRPR